MTPLRQRYLDWLAIVAANFMWATQIPAIKLIGSAAGPVAITFVPMAISTALLLPAVWIGNRRRGRITNWREWKHLLAAGMIRAYLVQFLCTVGARRTLAANAGVISLTIPLMTAAAAALMLGERLNRTRVAGFAVALAGVLVTSAPAIRGADLRDSGYLAGNLLFLGACAGSGISNTYFKLLGEKGYTALESLAYTSLAGSIASIPLFIWVEPLSLRRVETPALLAILELGIVAYGVSTLLFIGVLQRLDASQATLGTYLMPFFIELLAVVLLKEKLSAAVIAGGAIVACATIFTTICDRPTLPNASMRPGTATKTAGGL